MPRVAPPRRSTTGRLPGQRSPRCPGGASWLRLGLAVTLMVTAAAAGAAQVKEVPLADLVARSQGIYVVQVRNKVTSRSTCIWSRGFAFSVKETLHGPPLKEGTLLSTFNTHAKGCRVRWPFVYRTSVKWPVKRGQRLLVFTGTGVQRAYESLSHRGRVDHALKARRQGAPQPASRPSAPEPKPETRAEVRFHGRVEAITTRPRFQGTMVPLHADVRFVVTVKVKRAATPDRHVVAGRPVHLGIHSVARTFGGLGLTRARQVRGHAFSFTITRETRATKVRYHGLRVGPAPAAR